MKPVSSLLDVFTTSCTVVCMVVTAYGQVLALREAPAYPADLADRRLPHALGDLLGVVLAVDPAACPASGEGCC
jgi:hypothetical protein